MATTEVILREKIDGLGAEADIVKVRGGYARNFLIPGGKAFEATKGNLRNIEHLKEMRARREADELANAEKVATKIRKLKLTLELSIGQGGKAFGSITTNDIATAVNEKAGTDLDRHQFVLEQPIKYTGDFDIPVKLHPDIDVSLTLKVRPEAEPTEGEESVADE
ncbi:MAG: 50S ribosomal protein L9 [Verrucomicrobiae bacterium]|nr:50S ribosomal protein L9 [Verrucomicrobiae bacterium]MCP5541470.1 50S ribosomal protein L9 [Akkermansiaceae bacterium]MCP5550319.1 50S ribosomal protein L9 [Akkermansiaceae bacterium]